MESKNYERRVRGTSRFIANNANNSKRNCKRNRVSRFCLINNAITLERIARINIPQIIVGNPLANDFFNGTNFGSNNNFESLILPSGTPSSTFSPY